MSTDAHYIFCYEELPYVKPTPMEKDIIYLKENHGGFFQNITETTIYWEKPKYTLMDNEFKNLMADQILERRDCELWKIIR
jgi:hypothetical protein